MGKNSPAAIPRICPNCGEGNPPAASLQYLFGRRYLRNQCRACGHPLDGSAASVLDRVQGAQTYFAFYFLNVFVWAAIGMFAALALSIAFSLSLEANRWLAIGGLVAGGVFGVHRAERTRRRKKILAARSG